MSVEEINAKTEVRKEEINIDELLGAGTSSVMNANEPDEKSIFSPVTVDTGFLDPQPEKVVKTAEELAEEAKAAAEAAAAKATADAAKTPEELAEEAKLAEIEAAKDPLEVLDYDAKALLEKGVEDAKKGGRPTGMVTAAKNLIKSGVLMPFVDADGNDESVENYTAKDFEELYRANLEQNKEKVQKEIPKQFYDALPPDMQKAYEYIAQGGTDLKTMFATLATANEIRELDISTEDGQKNAIRSFLYATSFGTAEEVEQEITELEDRGHLEKKAAQFKPKLDSMQEAIVNKKVADEAALSKKRQEQSAMYVDSVFKALDAKELNGVELDGKTQSMLYAGLTQSNYPSINGNKTNMLGHLLEKYQWIEPRHDLIAEALWLLSDPEGYKAKQGAVVKNETATETLRTLKTEQSLKTATGRQIEKDESAKIPKRGGLQRQPKEFFKR